MKPTSLVFLILLIIISSCEIFNPPTQNYSNKILFTSLRSGTSQLYIMDPDGNNIQQITKGKYSHWMGKWSSDASQIACKTDENATTNNIQMIVMDSNGKNETFIHSAVNFNWMHDSSEIVFSYMPMGESGYYTTNILTAFRNEYLIYNDYNTGIINDYPCCSSDNNKIAFSSNRDFLPENSSRSEIYLMDNNGQNQTRLTYLDAHSTYPAFWIDSLIFYHSEGDLYSYNLYDSSTIKICDLDNYACTNSCISAGNDKIIFIAKEYISSNTYLYVMNIDGTNIHTIIPDSTVSSCDWSKQNN